LLVTGFDVVIPVEVFKNYEITLKTLIFQDRFGIRLKMQVSGVAEQT
jgi:hypothetical protein